MYGLGVTNSRKLGVTWDRGDMGNREVSHLKDGEGTPGGNGYVGALRHRDRILVCCLLLW